MTDNVGTHVRKDARSLWPFLGSGSARLHKWSAWDDVMEVAAQIQGHTSALRPSILISTISLIDRLV